MDDADLRLRREGVSRSCLAAKQIAPAAPDWLERFAAAHSLRESVGDVCVRIDPTDTSSPVTVSAGTEIEWPQIGIGLGLPLSSF